MKRLFIFFAAVAFAGAISAEVITMDLTTATNLNSEAIKYETKHTPVTFFNDLKDVMDSTYSENLSYAKLMTNDGAFILDHLPTAKSYGGTSWEGFTISKNASDTACQFACTAKGGVDGVGTPFVVGYYSEYAALALLDYSPCHVTFSDQYYPVEVMICMDGLTKLDITKGNGTAHAFTENDTLTLKIYAIDDEGYNDDEVEPIIYKMAEGKQFENGWVKIDLRPLGKTYGLNFEMSSTDKSYGMANTSLYFAMDKLTISSTKPAQVATFENEVGGINIAKADTCWQGADVPVIGWNSWTSGTYNFRSYYGGNSGYGDYFTSFTVTNETANTSTGYTEAYRSAKGGAYEGENFAVWNMYNDTITFDAQVVPGFFINNTAYAVTSMVNGDSFAKAFGKDDWFKLTCIGVKGGAEVATKDFYLAQNGEYVVGWTYVDLSELGEIDGLTFTMTSSDIGDWGMNTPAYFAMDNFGAAKPDPYVEPERASFPERPSAINAVNDNEHVTKIIRNGQVLIIKGNNIYNVLGNEVK